MNAGKKIVGVLLFLCLAALFSGTALAYPRDRYKDLKGTLDITVEPALIPVMKQAAQNIMADFPDIRITVAGGGSGAGVNTFSFAFDGVAVAVNPANPVKNLTSAQIADIYCGKIKDWKELGGTPGEINFFGREDGSGTRTTFMGKVLGNVEPDSSVNVVSSHDAMRTAIANDKRAIGYVGIRYPYEEPSISFVVVDGVFPSPHSVVNRTYMIARTLYYHMNAKETPELTVVFHGYIHSCGGECVIKSNRYFPIFTIMYDR